MKECLYETHRLEWRELEIEIRYCPCYFGGDDYRVAHIEIETACRSPLPITETGYRSQFTNPELVAKYRGPMEFVEAWLDTEEKSNGWREGELKRRQYSLF